MPLANALSLGYPKSLPQCALSLSLSRCAFSFAALQERDRPFALRPSGFSLTHSRSPPGSREEACRCDEGSAHDRQLCLCMSQPQCLCECTSCLKPSV